MDIRRLLERLKRPEVVLGILLVFGFLIRVHGLDSASLWHDETVTANAATSLLQTGVPDFPSGFEYWRSFPHTLLVAVSAFFLDSSDFALRFPSVIIGAATIALTYFVGRELYSERVGLVGAALMTFSGFHIAWSTQARMYITLQLLFLAAVYLIYRCGEEPSPENFVALGAVTSLAVVTHVTAYILPFIALTYFLYVRGFPENNKNRVLLAGIPLIVLGVTELFYFSYIDIINGLKFQTDTIFHYFRIIDLHLSAFTFFGLVGLLAGLKTKKDESVLTALAVFPAVYVLLFHVEGVSLRYLFFTLSFLCIWSGNAVERAYNRFEHIQIVGFAVTAVLIVSASAGSAFLGETSYNPDLDHESVYEHVKENSQPDDVLITQSAAPAVHYYRPPDYALFAGKVDSADYSYKGVDRYGGAEFLRNNSELQKVVAQNRRGWIVLSASAYRFHSEETQELLSGLNKSFETKTYTVWKWER